MRGCATCVAARVVGFMAHLRENGLWLWIGEADPALAALAEAGMEEAEVQHALKAVACGCAEDWARFDAVFDGCWRNGGRVRCRAVPAGQPAAARPGRAGEGACGDAAGLAAGREAADAGDGEGRLIATAARNRRRQDWRGLVSAEDIREGRVGVWALGQALRDRRSRRRWAARRGAALDLRWTIRVSVGGGGSLCGCRGGRGRSDR